MSDQERIAKLEERFDALDKEIESIKEEQRGIRNKTERTSIDMATIIEKLSTLIKNLEDHEKLHEKNGEKKYKITDIILALGMLALAFFQFLKA